MGNENQRVVFEGQLNNSRRKNIFSGSHTPSEAVNQSHRGSKVGQQQPLPPSSYQTPLVQSSIKDNKSVKSIQRSSAPNPAPSHEPSHAPSPVQQIERSLVQVNYSEIPPAERYPTKIPYYNAWSLPIQKYYLEERGPYQPEEESAPVPERRQMREFNSGALEEIMAEKMKDEMVATQRNKRRQNLNMV